MIGYILLITFAVVIAGVVFQWLKTYVPKEGIDCPDGVSMYISEYDINESELTLKLRNNGKFSIDGIFIYYSNSSEQEIATKKIADKIKSSGAELYGAGLTFSPKFEPGSNDRTLKFNVTGIDYIYAIEMTPLRLQEEKKRTQVVSCTNAKTKKILDENTAVLMGTCTDGDGDDCNACDSFGNPIDGCGCNHAIDLTCLCDKSESDINDC